jgi:hypothetical protein
MTVAVHRDTESRLHPGWGIIDEGIPHRRWFLELCVPGRSVALLGPEEVAR